MKVMSKTPTHVRHILMFLFLVLRPSLHAIQPEYISCLNNSDYLCQKCSKSGCTRCFNGFLSLDGVCEKIEILVEGCSSYSQNGKCLTCKTGFYFYFGDCKKLKITDCYFETKSLAGCLGCKGNLVDRNRECPLNRSCNIENCDLCMVVFGRVSCGECAKGFKRRVSSEDFRIFTQCLPDSENNLGCSTVKHNTDFCFHCEFGYFWDSSSASGCVHSPFDSNSPLFSLHQIFIAAILFLIV